jgi:hypothetical protein
VFFKKEAHINIVCPDPHRLPLKGSLFKLLENQVGPGYLKLPF